MTTDFKRAVLAAFALGLLAACAPPVSLKINGRPSEYLQARAELREGRWRVSADLPGGRWRVALREGTPVWLEAAGDRSRAWWLVPEARMREGRPFLLELTGSQDGAPAMTLEIRPKPRGPSLSEVAMELLYVVVEGTSRSGQ